MDKFRRIIEGGFNGFNTDDARQIIRNSAEVTAYVDSKRAHFAYVQQLMNDKIIDEAMGRVRARGEFEYDREGGLVYTPDRNRVQQPRQILREEYPSSRVNPYYNQPQQPVQNNNDVVARLEAMEREMSALREENRQLRNRYDNLR